MDSQIKHLPRATKKSTSTRFLTCEFCIMNNDGNATATKDKELVNKALLDGKKVFKVITYELRIRRPLKNKEE